MLALIDKDNMAFVEQKLGRIGSFLRVGQREESRLKVLIPSKEAVMSEEEKLRRLSCDYGSLQFSYIFNDEKPIYPALFVRRKMRFLANTPWIKTVEELYEINERLLQELFSGKAINVIDEPLGANSRISLIPEQIDAQCLEKQIEGARSVERFYRSGFIAMTLPTEEKLYEFVLKNNF